MYDEKIEALIKAALADGVLTEKEKQILFKRAQQEGIDLDEFEMVLDARLYELQKDAAKEAEKSEAAPKSDKFGDVRKCPACGSIVVGGMAVCEECGYAFSNVDANRTCQRLFEELMQIEKRDSEKKGESKGDLKGVFTSFLASALSGDSDSATKEKMALISNYAIPNTRADLIDMLTSIQGKVNSKAGKDGFDEYRHEDLGYAYWQLYINCINKAKVNFADDKSFSRYYDFYEEELQRSKKKKFGFF